MDSTYLLPIHSISSPCQPAPKGYVPIISRANPQPISKPLCYDTVEENAREVEEKQKYKCKHACIAASFAVLTLLNAREECAKPISRSQSPDFEISVSARRD
tara:strand:+ start:58 stop:363 length:306 start_codon:yes stop_codon:yes gene_type:complete